MAKSSTRSRSQRPPAIAARWAPSLGAALALGAAAAVGWAAVASRASSSASAHPLFSSSPGGAMVGVWDEPDIAAAVTARQPTLWHTSFVGRWAALERWRGGGRLELLVPWAQARVQAGPEFVLTEPRRGSAPLLQRSPEMLGHGTRNASVAQILRSGGGGGGAETLYYSGTVGGAQTGHWDERAILDDLEPRAALELNDTPPLLPGEHQPPDGAAAPPANRTSLRLWMSGAGTLSRTHYDKGHNLFAQLVGSKEVLLWPPEQLPLLHLYPAIHAAHRQSQSPLEARAALSAAGRLPLFNTSTPRLVRLRPGDLLYIPPYWAHAVRSVGASVSLASFSDSWEQARWARSGWHLAPLGRLAADECQRARGASALALAFLRACEGTLRLSAQQLLASLYASRYAPIYGAAGAADVGGDEALERCLRSPPPPTAPEASATLRARLQATGEAVAALLSSPDAGWQQRSFTPAVARELAADYAEELFGWACGADGAWRLLRLLALHPAERLLGVPLLRA